MVVSVSGTLKMKSTVIPVFIFVINFELKQNVSETESNWHFRKNVKNMSTKTTKCIWGHFQGIFINFICKDCRITTATCKHCHLVVSPSDEALRKFLSLPIVAKSSHLKCGRVCGSAFENFAIHEN